MKNKLLNVVLLVVSLLVCALGLFACAEKGDNDTHTHRYVNYEYNYDATCVKDGTETGRCQICGKTDTQTSNEHLRTGEHQYENGVCKICGATENVVVRDYNTVTFNPNGGSCSVENKQFEVGKVMQELPTPILNGYRFKGWYDVYDELYDTTSVMPNRALSLTARWEKIVSTYSDDYVSLKPATTGVKSDNHRYFGVDACVYVEIKSDDLKGGVGTDNNFTLRTLDGMEYAVKEGYSWIWYYDDGFSNVNGAQRFSLHYGNNLQFVTVNNSSGVTVKTYLVNIYVLHDYNVNLYKTIYDTNSYDSIRVIENEMFPASTAAASLGSLEFDKRVYYNENIADYVAFDYSTAITKDWDLYQTYKPVTMQAELNGGTLDGAGEVSIKPYSPYTTLPVPQKDGCDFLGWKMGEKYFANIQGYVGKNYITESNATETLTAVFEKKKYHYDFIDDTLKTYHTVPVVTYADEFMSEILQVLYVPYNTDCALPTITPQKADNVFYEWSVRSSETNALVPFDFNTKIIKPVALIASTVPSEYSGTTLPLNKETACSQTGTYTVYLPTASRYTLNVTTTGNVAFTVNAYGIISAKNYTASSSTPANVNLDYYTYNLGTSQRTVGYVTFNVTSCSGSFTVNVQGATGETEGTPMTVNATNLVDLGEEFAISEQVVCADKSGYTFVGWYNGETELTNDFSYTFEMLPENVTYKAKWIKVTVVSDNAMAGDVSLLHDIYKVEDRATITAKSTNMGYTFVGWYNGETELTNDVNYTFAMPSEHITYTAKWKVNDELNNFTFTSTTSTLTLTGIKDKTVAAIIVPDYVTSIGEGVFNGCDKLESISLPFVGGSKTETTASKSTLFGYIFGTDSYTGGTSTKQYYSSINYSTYYIPTLLTSVTITGGNILYGALYNCSSLTSVTIPNSVTSIGISAFYGCSSLTSIEIPNSVTSIGDSAFYGCSSLTSIEIPNSVTSIGDSAFYDCRKLIIYCEATSKPSGWDSQWCASYQPIIWKYKNNNKDENGFEHVIIDWVRYRLKDRIATIECQPSNIIGAISIPSSVTHNNETYYVTIIMNYAFYGCSSLTSIEIPNSVTSIGSYAFYGCSSLTSIEIPNSVTSIGNGAFYGCSSLTSIEIPNGVTSIWSSAFYGCSSLTSIEIPNSVTSIGNWAFDGCSGLTSIEIPNSVTSIGDYAFRGCSSLTSIEIPNGVTSIENYAFRGCSKLTSIEIPNSVTSIGDSAFYGCSSLTSIEIPNSVTSIRNDAFAKCSKLTIYCEAKRKPNGWYYNWNSSNRPVVWDYKNQQN